MVGRMASEGAGSALPHNSASLAPQCAHTDVTMIVRADTRKHVRRRARGVLPSYHSHNTGWRWHSITEAVAAPRVGCRRAVCVSRGVPHAPRVVCVCACMRLSVRAHG